jgi:hypothetical protein
MTQRGELKCMTENDTEEKQRKNISHFLKIILVGHTETRYYFIYSISV